MSEHKLTSDLLRGHTNTMILRLVSEADRYGYEIVKLIAGLTAKSTDGATAFSYPIIFLPFISSVFAPTRSMPLVVRVFAENQPVTAIVGTTHALLSGQPLSHDIWVALAWCVGILVVAYIFAMRAYKKRV